MHVLPVVASGKRKPLISFTQSCPSSRCLIHRDEHDLVRLDRRSCGHLETRNENNGVSVGVARRVRLIRNNQLPDVVVQTRERLVKRLRSVSLARTRESATTTGISGHESALSHDSSNNNFVDREYEALRDWSNSNLQYVDFTFDASKKKISEVSWVALCTLFLEALRNSEEMREEVRSSPECCVCLESFYEGDGLILLHCGHRFHLMCLQPWVQTCSDCLYCRAKIIC